MAEEKTLRERWIAALRSGEYKQGHGELRTPDGGFCCIGVACDLVDGASWDRARNEYAPAEWRGTMTLGACEQLGIGPVVGNILANKNDGGMPFAEIADYIEAHPEIDPKWPPEVTG